MDWIQPNPRLRKLLTRHRQITYAPLGIVQIRRNVSRTAVVWCASLCGKRETRASLGKFEVLRLRWSDHNLPRWQSCCQTLSCLGSVGVVLLTYPLGVGIACSSLAGRVEIALRGALEKQISGSFRPLHSRAQRANSRFTSLNAWRAKAKSACEWAAEI